MVRIVIECYPKNAVKKLHNWTIGPFPILWKLRFNGYLIDLSSNMYINLVFNVTNLFPYRGIFEPLVFLSSVSTGISSTLVPHAPSYALEQLSTIIDVLDDEFVTSHSGGYYCFLVYLERSSYYWWYFNN